MSTNNYAAINMSSNVNSTFSNEAIDDLIIYTTSNQSILIGPASGSNAAIKIAYSNTSNVVTVSGDINFTGKFLQNGSPYIGSQWTTNTSNVYISGSNVAIGKTSAAAALDVVGTIIASSNIISGGSITVTSNLTGSTATFFGQVGVNSLVSSTTIQTSGGNISAGAGTISAQNGNITNITALGTANINNLTTSFSNYFFGAFTSNYGNMYVGSNLLTSNIIASNVTINNLLTASNINFTGSFLQNGLPYIGSQWTTSNGGSNVYITGSNVGIGTSTPGFPLDVGGSAAFSGTTNTRIFINRATSNDINSVVFSRGGAATANGEAEIGLAGDTSLRFRVNSTLGSYTTQLSILSNGNIVVTSNLIAPSGTITTITNSNLSTSNLTVGTNLTTPSANITTLLVNTSLTTPLATITTLNSTAGTIGSIVNNSLNTSNVTVNTNLTAPLSTITTLSNNTLSTSNITVGTSLTAPSGTIATLTSTTGTIGSIVNNSLNTSNVTINTNLTASNIITGNIQGQLTPSTTNSSVTAVQNQTPSSGQFILWSQSIGNYTSSNATVGSFTGIAKYTATRNGTLTIAATNWTTGRVAATDNVLYTLNIYDAVNTIIGSYNKAQFQSTTFDILTGQSWGIVKNEAAAYAIYSPSTLSVSELIYVSPSTLNLVATNVMASSNLQVAGNLQMTSTVNFKGIVLDRPNGSLATISVPTFWNSNASTVYITGSNIAINKTTATVALDVNGSITATSNITASNINFTGSLLQNGSPYIGSQWTTNTSNIYITGSNVGIGTTIPAYLLDVNGTVRTGNSLIVGTTGGGGSTISMLDITNAAWSMSTSGFQLSFANNNGGSYANKFVVSNTGNISAPGNLTLSGPNSTDSYLTIYSGNPNNYPFQFRRTGFTQELIVGMRYPGGSVQPADTSKNGALSVGGELSGRSINATGTINASGADYAEYMIKNGLFTVQRGDVIGIDSNGLITNKFSESITFAIKSTNPSFVGGDTWNIADQESVDRISFCGQAPVNFSSLINVNVGDYIIPTSGSNDSIDKMTVSYSNVSFDQFKSSVGRIIKVNDSNVIAIVKII